ncbi:pyridoxamine 5'-phosphate oxidase family protein [Iocasia frigidifontis]|uniref:Pyridoxamine 5'-phosphate oxidase family protein n=1 Tax=Iocasia fonsfrigidae TaxID=2682810 RepID=A0A8A7KBQ9_9FIRM|nr:pyridoxamine 5'-phosphate oxidase family protein [Iocasia fonsfrigidae]MTI61931.1 pyridoxamine 5'-phosphate oxidase family protein [Bacillota bacterium]QTL97525.1 pyridoxamine 5'-phosphate oxidase family protein [Iocasia fonsfrigidae]
MILDFDTLKEEIIDLLDKKRIMVLATSANDRVSARAMSCINKGLDIFFQTDKNFLKFKQLEKNPNVALCVDNVQIEGIAVQKGHILNDENKYFLDLYKEKHYGSYKAYSHLEDNILIKVEPRLITLWKYEGNKSLREFLYVEDNKAVREYYKIIK